MKILFLHGWHSVVGGVKPTHLKQRGHTIINPALDDDDFDLAIRIAQAEFDMHQPDVVVGSSRGGAVAMNIASLDKPLVLLCPAWKNWGTVTKLKPNSIVLHSRADDVIPFADSEELVARSRLPSDALIEVGSDHRLADESSLSVMTWACELLASGVSIPSAESDDGQPPLPQTSVNVATSQAEAAYICDACGEEIIVPVDVTEGSTQTYVEDCPVCCRANTIHVQLDEDGELRAWAEPEQDRE